MYWHKKLRFTLFRLFQEASHSSQKLAAPLLTHSQTFITTMANFQRWERRILRIGPVIGIPCLNPRRRMCCNGMARTDVVRRNSDRRLS